MAMASGGEWDTLPGEAVRTPHGDPLGMPEVGVVMSPIDGPAATHAQPPTNLDNIADQLRIALDPDSVARRDTKQSTEGVILNAARICGFEDAKKVSLETTAEVTLAVVSAERERHEENKERDRQRSARWKSDVDDLHPFHLAGCWLKTHACIPCAFSCGQIDNMTSTMIRNHGCSFCGPIPLWPHGKTWHRSDGKSNEYRRQHDQWAEPLVFQSRSRATSGKAVYRLLCAADASLKAHLKPDDLEGCWLWYCYPLCWAVYGVESYSDSLLSNIGCCFVGPIPFCPVYDFLQKRKDTRSFVRIKDDAGVLYLSERFGVDGMALTCKCPCRCGMCFGGTRKNETV
mmetsp:Transcript_23383/g.61191  ORF Transcript_23383/g.61191 Transcript_23383/m.61191 type:complete len:344 (-) Transcript_23383:45-1076(-)